MKIIVKTVTIEVPLPFADDEGQAFVDRLEESLDAVLDAAVKGVIEAARVDRVPLANVAIVNVTD